MRRTRAGMAALAVSIAAAGLGPAPVGAREEPAGCDQILLRGLSNATRVEELEGSGFAEFHAPSGLGWSSDGEHLAWADSNELTFADPDGVPLAIVTPEDLAIVQGFQTFWWTPWFPAVVLDTRQNGYFIVDADGDVRAGGYSTRPGLSPTGDRVVVPRLDGLWVEDLDGNRLVELTASPPPGVTFAWNQFPVWSADGAYVAWWSSASGAGDPNDDAVWVARADGTDRIRLGDSRRGSIDIGREVQWIGGTHTLTWRDHEGRGPAGLINESVWTGGPGQSAERLWLQSDGYIADLDISVDGRSFLLRLNDVLYVFPLDDLNSPHLELPKDDFDFNSATLARDGSFSVSSRTADETLLFGPTGVLLDEFEGDDAQFRPCPGFVDVRGDSFALRDISVIKSLGITKGTSPALYSPFDRVTREQMAAFLARLWEALGNECGGTLGEFVDVPVSSFAYEAVACIKDLGVTKGTGDGSTYSPADFVTREQMAAFLARLWEALGNTCGGTPGEFSDVLVSSFAYEAVACIKAIGVTTGTSPTTYSPGNHVTREQMAAFIARLWRAA